MLFHAYVLGFDGGGTKTDCVLMDETGAILARSRSGLPTPRLSAGGVTHCAFGSGNRRIASRERSEQDVAYVLGGVSGAAESNMRWDLMRGLQPRFPKSYGYHNE